MSNPSFLMVELPDEHPDQIGVLRRAAKVVRDGGGEVLAWAQAGEVKCLEPGSVASGILLARWRDADRLAEVTTEQLVPALHDAVPAAMTPLVLQVNGLPEHGLPEMMDIPTVASVPVAPRHPRNALMVIRGRAFDSARMDQYRDVILPMMKERDSYYEVFALGPDEVTALAGEWTEQIFAISRWPARASAEDFWYSERYQRQAIPLRIGAGRFSVHVLDAAD